MSFVSKKRNNGMVNNDIWRYQTLNNVKILPNFNDVPRFINGLCRTLKIDKYPGGNEFVRKFCESIVDWRDTYLDGFEYSNENDELCYVLLLVRPTRDGRSTEVISTQHVLSKSSINRNDGSEVTVKAHKASIWLKERACNELRLPTQTTHELMYQSVNYPIIDTSNCTIHLGGKTKTVTSDEVRCIIQQSNPDTSYQGWRYVLINRAKHGKSFWECIPEIAEYSQRCHPAEKFFEKLGKEIRAVKDVNRLEYPCLHKNQLCVLIILIQATNENVIEMACRFQMDTD